ncbi:MAG: DUF4442 domain-containing protein [Oligoflexia bacterium]|nr:DUF4442 domain-containing protein [Oligoflexia bacterium]
MQKKFSSVGRNFVEKVDQLLPKPISATALLKSFGFFKVPLLFMVNPKVDSIDDDKAIVSIPLNKLTKNHLRSMYFGALAIGADSAVGILAFHHIRKQKKNLHFSFKDFQAEFLKRPESRVYFVCDQGSEIAAAVEKAIQTKERINLSVPAIAETRKGTVVETVAKFTLTLSLRDKS